MTTIQRLQRATTWMWVALLGFCLAACNAHDHAKEGHQHAEETHNHQEENHNHAAEDPHGHEGHDHEADEDNHRFKTHVEDVHFTREQAQAAQLKVEVIHAAPFSSALKVSGQIEAPLGEECDVVARSTGTVHFARHDMSEGTAVKAGQLLAIISARNMQDGDPAQKAKIAYDTARKDYERAKALAADQIISAKELEQRRAALQLARASWEALRGAGGKGVSVTSPLGGYVKSVIAREGSFVSVGDPILTITQNRRLQLRADVPECRYGLLKQVRTAHFRASSDQTVYELDDLHGRLHSYARTLNGTDGYLPIIFSFDNVGDLVAGSYAEVWLITRERQGVLSLPQSALIEEQGTYYIFIQHHEQPEEYHRQEVMLGESNGSRVEIKSGLKDGDHVVTRGAYQLKLASVTTMPEGHNHNH